MCGGSSIWRARMWRAMSFMPARSRRLFMGNPAMLEDILDGLFEIAKADGVLHPCESTFLEQVAEIFGFAPNEFRRIRASHFAPELTDPYVILGLSYVAGTRSEIRQTYRRLVRENHPDSLMARGVPEEFIKLANDKLAAINSAYEKIHRTRASNEVERPSPNHDDRGGAPIDMLVLHYTGMAAAKRRCPGFAIPRPKSRRTTPSTKTARSTPWCPKRGAPGMPASPSGRECDINACSIGIELVNPGLEFGYRAFPIGQIVALKKLCREILARHPIPAGRVLGHSDIAPARKQDPGELFPWAELAAAGIGLWPNLRAANAAPRPHPLWLRPRCGGGQNHHRLPAPFPSRKLDGLWDGECARLLAGLLALLPAPGL